MSQMFPLLIIYTTSLDNNQKPTICVQELYLSVLTHNYKKENHPPKHIMTYPTFLPPYKATPIIPFADLLQTSMNDFYHYLNSISFNQFQTIKDTFNNNANIPPINIYSLYWHLIKKQYKLNYNADN